MEKWTRRKFFLTTLAGGMAASTKGLLGATPGRKAFTADALQHARGEGKGARPLIVSAANGIHHLDAGMAVLKGGGDTLDAVLAVVTKVEDDPNDDSVGYGGLPNEDGVVQLDACVMHGPTGRCGAVGAIEKIKNPSLVAKTMMEKTNHIFIVGAGAEKFAVDEGFQTMNLLTDRSRLAWLAWKASADTLLRPPRPIVAGAE
ncbi:MAG: isoaspartyl peptidase/L-asparaginase [Candidatus Acidiferrales bacterium]